jgi:hypothetical protein
LYRYTDELCYLETEIKTGLKKFTAAARSIADAFTAAVVVSTRY